MLPGQEGSSISAQLVVASRLFSQTPCLTHCYRDSIIMETKSFWHWVQPWSRLRSPSTKMIQNVPTKIRTSWRISFGPSGRHGKLLMYSTKSFAEVLRNATHSNAQWVRVQIQNDHMTHMTHMNQAGSRWFKLLQVGSECAAVNILADLHILSIWGEIHSARRVPTAWNCLVGNSRCKMQTSPNSNSHQT